VSDVSGQANWVRLFRVACAIIRQVNSKQAVIDHWTFGGGTALMLQLDHRESHDIDIFLTDPQQLPYLDPQKHDFRLDIHLDAYEGDGVRSLKLVFSVGEIDFHRREFTDIVADDAKANRRRKCSVGNGARDYSQESLLSGIQYHASRYLRYCRSWERKRGCHHSGIALLQRPGWHKRLVPWQSLIPSL